MLELSVTPEFYGNYYDIGEWEKGKPTDLTQAILDTYDVSKEYFISMVEDVFNLRREDFVEDESILNPYENPSLFAEIHLRTIENNSCSIRGGGKTPIITSVYINDHYYFDVWDV